MSPHSRRNWRNELSLVVESSFEDGAVPSGESPIPVAPVPVCVCVHCVCVCGVHCACMCALCVCMWCALCMCVCMMHIVSIKPKAQPHNHVITS